MSALPIESVRVVRGPEAAAAVLDPVRLRLIHELAEPASATDLAKRIGQPRQRVNYHLRELERAGLVRLIAERRKGNCTERIVQAVARSYLISPEVLGAMSADPSKIADRTSSAYLVAVAGAALREVGILRDRAERAGEALPTLAIQTEVRFDSAAAMDAFAEELTEAVARLVAKHHAGEHSVAPDGRVFKVFLGSYPAIAGDDAAPAPSAAEELHSERAA